MKSTQRITIALTIDLPDTQPADVEGFLGHPELKHLIEHLTHFGDELQADIANSCGEPSTVGVTISTETVRYDL